MRARVPLACHDRACAVLTMMSEEDEEEYTETDGLIKAGASLSTLLALRKVGPAAQ